jgi:hypothetical protein
MWMDFARVIRAETGRLRVAPFVLSSRLSAWCIASAHHAAAYRAEPARPCAGVSQYQRAERDSGQILPGFLGLSVDEPSVSWGAVFDGTLEMDSAPWTFCRRFC